MTKRAESLARRPVGSRRHLSAIILAAGKSSRFLGTKQLMKLAGKSLVERAVETAIRARIDDVIVVVGHEAESVASEVPRAKGVRVVVNAEFASGVASSIRAGVLALKGKTDGAVVLLVDQPFVGASLLRRMTKAFEANRPGETIIAADYSGVVAPPVIFSKGFFGELARLRGDRGAKSVITRHRRALSTVKVGSRGTLADVDTREDFAVARESHLEG